MYFLAEHLFERTRISRITRTEGRASQSLRGITLLIAFELHEYHPEQASLCVQENPDGNSCYSNAISKSLSVW